MPRSMASLAARNAYAGPPTNVRIQASADAYTSSAGTTLSTSPIRSASSAATNRPEKMISLARAEPTSRASRWVPPAPGMTPRRISGCPSLAFSPTTRKSQARASSQPPPNAYPVTAATVGFWMRATEVMELCSAADRSTMSTYDMACISLMSAPAANTFSPP